MSSYWDNALEGAKEESGGGVVGLGRIDLAYFCFVSGFAGDERSKCLFVPADSTKETRATTRKAAQKFIVASGGEVKNARWCSVTTLYKDKCSRGGSEVTWDYDRLETVPIWPYRADPTGPSAARLVVEQNERLGVPGGENFWGRFVWPNDPYAESLGEAGKTKKDRDNNLVFPKVCLVAQVFEDKAEAQEYIGGAAAEAAAASGSKDEGFNEETWGILLPDMTKEVITDSKLPKVVAEDYGVPATELWQHFDEVTRDLLDVRMSDEIIGGKGKAAVARDYGVRLPEMIKRLKAAEDETPD